MKQPVPDLLVRDRLLAPVLAGIEELTDIMHAAPGSPAAGVVLRGLAVLAVPAIETSLSDCLHYFYSSRPSSIQGKDFSVTPAELLYAPTGTSVLTTRGREKVKRLGYQPFDQLLNVVLREMELPQNCIDIQKVQDFIEFKETRNSILHSKLKASESYLTKSGAASRVTHIGDRLTLDALYVLHQVMNAAAVLDAFRTAIARQYKDFTRVNAIRRLWEWMFTSPVMQFEDFWTVDQCADEVVGYKSDADTARLSNGERVKLGVWLTHYNSHRELGPEPLTMYSLDSENQRKVLYFLSVVDKIGVF